MGSDADEVHDSELWNAWESSHIAEPLFIFLNLSHFWFREDQLVEVFNKVKDQVKIQDCLLFVSALLFVYGLFVVLFLFIIVLGNENQLFRSMGSVWLGTLRRNHQVRRCLLQLQPAHLVSIRSRVLDST